MLRFIGQAFCLLLVAAGLLAAILASFCLLAMLIVWFQEGNLQSADRTMLAQGAKWLLGSCVLIAVAWWLHCKIVVNKTGDDSFRLVDSKSGHLEKLVQDVFETSFFILLALWLWVLTPGSAIIKIPVVAGWLAVGFLGMHARIALHEIGHLAAAWLLGLELRKIQVGVGRLLWSCSFANGLLCEWRAWWQGGFMSAIHRNPNGFRARQSLFVAAGPLADLIILWSAYQLITHAFGGLGAAFAQGAGGRVVFVLFWWTALSAAGGLVPHKRWMDHRRVWTDGYWLLRLWTGSNERIAELAQDSNWREALELLESACPRDVIHAGAVERKLSAHLASPVAFHEQRARLSSRLLRQRSFTSLPPA